MTDVNVTVRQLVPQGGADSNGYRIGFIDSGTKAAQNDVLVVTNASAVIFAGLSIDATGASETNTLSTNEITLTSATTGAVSGIIVYR